MTTKPRYTVWYQDAQYNGGAETVHLETDNHGEAEDALAFIEDMYGPMDRAGIRDSKVGLA